VDFEVEGCADEVRKAVEERVGRFADADAWDYWFGKVRDETWANASQATSELVEEIRRARRFMPRQVPTPAHPPTEDATTLPFAAPPWWPQHSERELDGYAETQQQVLNVLGREEPTTLQEQGDLIRQHLERQIQTPNESDTVLQFATFVDDAHRMVVGRTVFAGDTGKIRVYATPEGPVAIRGRPLFYLAVEARRISWQTGCEPYQAVDFLLSNVRFELPWVVAQPRRQSGVIDIRIGTPIVPAGDVTRAFAQALTWEQTEQPIVLREAPRRRRRPRERTALLLACVEKRKPGKKTLDDWRLLRKRWNTEHPGPVWEFPTPEAMRENYRRAARNAERE